MSIETIGAHNSLALICLSTPSPRVPNAKYTCLTSAKILFLTIGCALKFSAISFLRPRLTLRKERSSATFRRFRAPKYSCVSENTFNLPFSSGKLCAGISLGLYETLFMPQRWFFDSPFRKPSFR